MADLQAQIDELWERRAELEPDDKHARKLVREAVDLLDNGQARVAEVIGGGVMGKQGLKAGVLPLFRGADKKTLEHGPIDVGDQLELHTAVHDDLPGGGARG